MVIKLSKKINYTFLKIALLCYYASQKMVIQRAYVASWSSLKALDLKRISSA